MSFKRWLRDYSREYERELKEWQNKSGMHSLIPEGLDVQLIQQYGSYRADLATKRLVWATWALALATIILNILTLFII